MNSKRITGQFEQSTVAGEKVAAFVPAPLPPRAPAIVIEGALAEQTRQAEDSLRQLELAGDMVPSLDWFIYAFVRKEAVVSSQIEGTQATLVDLLNFEAKEGAGEEDEADLEVQEICNYLEGLDYARAQLADPKGLPVSMRLLNETHRRLMAGARGDHKGPGDVRRTQNWIGGTRPSAAQFVPPPPQALPALLGAFEKYLHADDRLPHIVRAGLLHVQFETIHPYLDGNGRIGRLLVALLFEHWKLLSRPLLYLSLFFKRHRDEYYRRLTLVRTEGDWEGWLRFFLEGVDTIATEGVASARELFMLVSADRARLLARRDASIHALRLFELLPKGPILSAARVAKQLEVTAPTAHRAIEALVKSKVLVETTGKKRDRSFAYHAYLERLREGTELEGEARKR